LIFRCRRAPLQQLRCHTTLQTQQRTQAWDCSMHQSNASLYQGCTHANSSSFNCCTDTRCFSIQHIPSATGCSPHLRFTAGGFQGTYVLDVHHATATFAAYSRPPPASHMQRCKDATTLAADACTHLRPRCTPRGLRCLLTLCCRLATSRSAAAPAQSCAGGHTAPSHTCSKSGHMFELKTIALQ
jgi:hypothetical protein